MLLHNLWRLLLLLEDPDFCPQFDRFPVRPAGACRGTAPWRWVWHHGRPGRPNPAPKSVITVTPRASIDEVSFDFGMR